MNDAAGYSIENAQRFEWSSISNHLNPGRRALLDDQILGHRVLDAGCGGGSYCAYLTSKGLNVVGVDVHDQFLDVARQKHPQIEFLKADLADLPFRDDQFETVFCFDVLEHIDDNAALRELVRVASHRVILAVPREADEMLPFNLVFSTYRDTTHQRYYTENSLHQLIQSVAPDSTFRVAPELPLPVDRLLLHLCDAKACGYLGITGKMLRTMKTLGCHVDNIAAWRGRRMLKLVASGAANMIPTGFNVTIELK